MSGEDAVGVALLSMVTASVSFTVAEAALLAGFRKRTGALSAFLGKLVSCGYCTGHWVAFGLVLVYRPRLFHAWWPLDYFLTALVIAWLAAFQWAALAWVLDRTGK